MKNLTKIIISFILIFSALGIVDTYAGIEGLNNIEGVNNITKHSIQNISDTGNIQNDIESVGFKILSIIKFIISGVLVIFIVYAGVQMILSMGTDEDALSTSKRQLWYTLVGLIFINIPFEIYNAFYSNKGTIDGSINGSWANQLANNQDNIFINFIAFDSTLNGGIVMFIQVAIFAIAVLMIVLSGIKIMTSRGNDEDVTEAKNKIIWSIVGLIFIGFIQTWQRLVYSGKISDGANLFQTVENLAMFLAGPIAIFFLTLAGYYYITANGDEEKTKKAKNIIINVVIATIILIASYSILLELNTLQIN